MIKQELAMAAYFLDLAADDYSNHGCNDLDEEFKAAANLSDDEKIEFVRQMYEWSGDLACRLLDGPIKATDFYSQPDWFIMRFLAGRLRHPDWSLTSTYCFECDNHARCDSAETCYGHHEGYPRRNAVTNGD